MADVELTPT